MMPTIEESLQNALEALAHSGFPPGGAVYDDLAQAIKQLKDGDSISDKLTDNDAEGKGPGKGRMPLLRRRDRPR